VQSNLIPLILQPNPSNCIVWIPPTFCPNPHCTLGYESLVHFELLGLLRINGSHHLLYNFTSPKLPFFSVLYSIIQVFRGTDTKNPTFLQLLRQWNDIEVKEALFTLIPVLTRVLLRSSFPESPVAFLEESLVPFLSTNKPNQTW
jgi:hypothetical protein